MAPLRPDVCGGQLRRSGGVIYVDGIPLRRREWVKAQNSSTLYAAVTLDLNSLARDQIIEAP